MTLTTWADFLLLEDPEGTGERYELHDGEAVLVPVPPGLRVKLRHRLMHLLQANVKDRGVVTVVFPYRPAATSSSGMRISPIFRIPSGREFHGTSLTTVLLR
jgi:hypothetical protein